MLWFERLYPRLGLPIWLGAIVIGFIPFLGLLTVGYALADLWARFLVDLPALVTFGLAVTLFSHFAARHVARTMENLRNYVQSMNPPGAAVKLEALYGSRGVVVTWVILAATTNPVFILVGGPYPSLGSALLTNGFPFIYWQLFIGTFAWAWGYSLFRIYRIGSALLNLRPFTEDRTLGLRPFGAASLRLTGLFIALMALLSVPVLAGANPAPFLAVLAGGLVFALVFFLLPLRSLHAQLLAAKKGRLHWIAQRYTRVMQQVEERGDGPLDEKLVGELSAIDKIQRDIQQIHTWPFDTGILVRLTAIILTVVAIITARVIQAVFGV